MRVEKLDREGNVLKRFNTVEAAAADAKVSVETVKRQLRGYGYGNNRRKPKAQCGFTWRYYGETKEETSKRPMHQLEDYYKSNRKKVYKLDENGTIVDTYESMREAARENNLHPSVAGHLLTGRRNRKSFLKKYGYDLKYKEDILFDSNQEKEETEEKILKEMYYINLLVGLVNRTLVDGAIYNLRGVKYEYSKEQDALISAEANPNITPIMREFYCQTCSVEEPLLTNEEKEFLKNILKAFEDTKSISKCAGLFGVDEFIRLEAYNPVNNVDLSTFKAGKYYNNLELNKSYTLEELKLK